MTFLRRRKANSAKESGFTLIELLVVILIIGILAAIAIPMFLNQRKSAADASLKSDIRSLVTEIETWQASSGKTAAEIPTGASPYWTIIVRDTPGTPFVGQVSGSQEVWPLGSEPMNVSEGVSLGVGTRLSQAKNGYCIAGNVEGGTYKATSSTASGKFKNALFYDSLDGGLKTPEQLTHDGACSYLKTRLDAEG